MRARVTQYWNDDFLRHNAVFFAGSMLVAVLNYLYHPIVSRMLTVHEFGELQAFLAIASQVGVISGVFGLIILNLRANRALDVHQQERLVRELYSLALGLTAVCAALLLLAAPYLSRTLELTSFAALLFTAFAVLIGTPRAFGRYHLQAEKRFATMSISDVIPAVGKVALAVLFIYLGWHVSGAVGAYALAALVGLIYIYPATAATIRFRGLTRPSLTPALTRELRYAGLILVATGFSTFLYTADIIVVRYFFDAETTGLYAGIATVARIIVFATGSITAVLMAHVTLSNTRAENHAAMRKALILIGLVGGGGLVVFTVLPALTVGLLMGERFLPLVHVLPLLSLLMAMVALVNLFVMYFLALRKYALIPIAFAGAGAIALFSLLWHNTVSHVVLGFLAGILLVLVLLGALYLSEHA